MSEIDQRLTDRIKKELAEDGLSQANGLIPLELIDQLREQSLGCVQHEIGLQNTTEFDDLGRILFAPMYGGAFLKILELDELYNMCRALVGSELQLYTMTTSCIPPNRSNYTNRIHRDTHIAINGFRPGIVMQILLDDFTPNNGAPLFLRGSQDDLLEPDNDRFESEAEQVLGKKGDVNFFDPRIWHRSTSNQSTEWRSCLLIGLIPTWMKQRFNVPEMMKDTDTSHCSPGPIQLLGFNNIPPSSWTEFYDRGQSAY